MTIEEIVIDYLTSNLPAGVSVSGFVPSPMPANFVTVEKTGSSEQNQIRNATIAVQSWGKTQYEAMTLNENVKDVLRGLPELPVVSACKCSTDYNYTDTTTNRSRYQALFKVVYYSA